MKRVIKKDSEHIGMTTYKNYSKEIINKHETVWVKVNAPVDRGVASLVEALSRFTGLRTIESCQGPPAWVCFDAGEGEWQQLADLVLNKLRSVAGDGARFEIVSDDGPLQGELTVIPEAIIDTVKRLHTVSFNRDDL